MKIQTHVFLIAVCLFTWGQACATVPDVWGVLDWPHTETVHLMVTPGGNGPSFAEATYFGGAPADATLRIQIWLQYGGGPPEPLVQFPGEDIWLQAPGLVACVGGASADGNTDSQGWVTFSSPPRMGGWMNPDDALVRLGVMISGDFLLDETGVPLTPDIVINSPDTNGDGVVDLGDLGLFSQAFYSGSHPFRTDFFWDGVLNLSDVGRIATTFADQCP